MTTRCKKTTYLYFILFVMTFALTNLSLYAAEQGILSRLDSGERNRMREAQLLYKAEEVEDSPWPERKMYSILDVEPLKAVAIFGDYESQPQYVPDMKNAKIVEQKSPTAVVVSYETDMPWPVVREEFTNEHQLSVYEVDGKKAYKLSWEQIKGSSAKESWGYARFEPYEDGKTVMEYVSFVHPVSPLAGLKGIKKRANEDFAESVAAVVEHIEKVCETKPAFVRRKIEKITNALNGEYVY